jgi:hypothetical protein
MNNLIGFVSPALYHNRSVKGAVDHTYRFMDTLLQLEVLAS